jgi:hypothetical protein
MHVRIRFIVNFPAAQTFVATIGRDAAGFDRLQAIQRLGQGAGERFEFLQLVTGEEVGMAEPSAGERALKQLHALRLPGEIFKRHAAGFIG